MKSLIYIDTSVPSAYFDHETPERSRVTQRWWEPELSKYQAIISSLMLTELNINPDFEERKGFLIMATLKLK